MKRPRTARALSAALVASVLPLFLLGCPKKPPPEQPDAAPPPPAEDAGTLAITTSDDDAGDGGDAAEGGKKYTGPGLSPNEARVEACCQRLRATFAAVPGGAQAPEAKGLIAQCEAIRAQVHTNPNAPELNGLKSLPGCH